MRTPPVQVGRGSPAYATVSVVVARPEPGFGVDVLVRMLPQLEMQSELAIVSALVALYQCVGSAAPAYGS